MSPLGETLRRARIARGITIEDAERVTRIHRKYLIALEEENFGILPAPVYARGFLRSYASYLGLDPADLLPFFPVGHVDEPKLEPLPQVRQPRTWSMSGVIALAAVGILILLVIGLYSLGSEGSGGSILSREAAPVAGGESPAAGAPAAEGPAGAEGGPAFAIPDLAGQSLEEAIAIVESAGATYVVVGIRQGDIPTGQVVDQSPPPGEVIQPGEIVTLIVSR